MCAQGCMDSPPRLESARGNPLWSPGIYMRLGAVAKTLPGTEPLEMSPDVFTSRCLLVSGSAVGGGGAGEKYRVCQKSFSQVPRLELRG